MVGCVVDIHPRGARPLHNAFHGCLKPHVSTMARSLRSHEVTFFQILRGLSPVSSKDCERLWDEKFAVASVSGANLVLYTKARPADKISYVRRRHPAYLHFLKF